MSKLLKLNSDSPHFYYSSLNFIEILYLIDYNVVEDYLIDTDLLPVIFENKVCVALNFQRYTSNFSNSQFLTQEIEMSIIVVPKVYFNDVPIVSFNEFINGEEQSNLIGLFRIHVPCDDNLAIQAGIDKFGEPKFKAHFDVEIPSENSSLLHQWKFSCFDCNNIKLIEVNIENLGLPQQTSYFSPVTYYGYKNGRLLSSKWNIFSTLNKYTIDFNEIIVQIKTGESKHKFVNDLNKLILPYSPVAIRTHQTKPVAVQGRPYYLD